MTEDRTALTKEELKEIEITPEMIEAGLLPLYRYHPESGVGDEETVVRIFQEMRRIDLSPR